jgi:hypothetical protein
MTGVHSQLEKIMSDDNHDNDSGGIIGTLFGLIILAILWPYLLAIVGILIVYAALGAIFNWIIENLPLTIFILLCFLGVVCVFRYRLIAKAYRYLLQSFAPQSREIFLAGNISMEGLPDFSQRKFIPSSNLYCYWCTKKLGIQAFESQGKYYCATCHAKQFKNLR